MPFATKTKESDKENKSDTDVWFLKKFGLKTLAEPQKKKEVETQKKLTVNTKSYKDFKQKIEEKLSLKRREDLERRHCFYNADNEIFSNKDEEEEEELTDEEEEVGDNEGDVDDEEEVGDNEGDVDDEEEEKEKCENKKEVEFDVDGAESLPLKRKMFDDDSLKNSPKRLKPKDDVEDDFVADINVVIDEDEDSINNDIESRKNFSQNQLPINELSHITLDLNGGDEVNGLNATASQDLNEALFLCSGTFGDSNENEFDSIDSEKPHSKPPKCSTTFPSFTGWNSSSQKSLTEVVDNFSSQSSKPFDSSKDCAKEDSNRTLVQKQLKSTIVFSDSEDSNLSMSSYSRGATKMGPSMLALIGESASKLDWSQHEKDFKSLRNEAKNPDQKNTAKVYPFDYSLEPYDEKNTSEKNIIESDDEITLSNLNDKITKSPSLRHFNQFKSDGNTNDFGEEKRPKNSSRRRILLESDNEGENDANEVDTNSEEKSTKMEETLPSNSDLNIFADDQLFTVDDDVEDSFENVNYNDYLNNDKNGNDSDEEEEDDTENEDSRSVKRQVKLKDILDYEASLSGDDVGSEDEEGDDENEYEIEEGDNDELPDDEEIRENLVKQYIKQTNDDEERRMLRLQEQFFADSDLHGLKNMDRSFRFRMREDANVDWSKVLGKLDDEMNNDADDDVEGGGDATDSIKKLNEKKIEMLKWKLEQEKKKLKFNNSGMECIEVFAQSSLLSLGEKTLFTEVPNSPSTSKLVDEEDRVSSVIVPRDSLLRRAGNLGHSLKETMTTVETRRHTLFTSLPSKDSKRYLFKK